LVFFNIPAIINIIELKGTINVEKMSFPSDHKSKSFKSTLRFLKIEDIKRDKKPAVIPTLYKL